MSGREPPSFAALLAEAVEAYRRVEAMAVWMGMDEAEFLARWREGLAQPSEWEEPTDVPS